MVPDTRTLAVDLPILVALGSGLCSVHGSMNWDSGSLEVRSVP